MSLTGDWDALAPSVVGMTSDLVRLPSQGGIDSPEPVLAYLERWLGEHGLAPRRLAEAGGAPVGITCDVETGQPGPRYVLDCCVDTAPFGNVDKWRLPPPSGQIEGGWLHGRGSSDSKAGIAAFCHLAERVRRLSGGLQGTLTLLFDADEHTGGFRGARRFFGDPAVRERGVAGVMIGYPGLHEVVTACRGFYRATVTVHGTAGHSGASDREVWRDSSVEKAARLAVRLRQSRLPERRAPGFDLPPTLTVTAISGGESWTVVPDTCSIKVDMRLTPVFGADEACRLLEEAVADVDREWPTVSPTSLDVPESWPAYALPDTSPVAAALLGSARELGVPARAGIVGMGNIGNYLAALGIEATAGFGARFRGLHALDECVAVDDLPVVGAAYELAVRRLLSAGD
jgi:succinyl-diaminopimelate desuccinylase